PERTVADRDDRCPHVAMTQVPEQCRPGVGGLPVTVSDRDELLLAVEAHTDDHETAQPFLLETHVEVHPVDPEVHVVPVCKVACHEGTVLVLPGRGEPGDHRSRQPGCRTEEPLAGRGEVACRESVEVEQWQDLGDLRGPAAPGRDDDGAELGLLAGFLVHALVVHPRCFDLDRSGPGLDLALSCVAVARHETVPVLVTLISELGEIRLHFGLQGRGEQSSLPLRGRSRPGRSDLPRPPRRCSLRSTSASLPRRRANAGCSFSSQRGRYVAPPGEWVIHNFRAYLHSPDP